MKRELVDGKLQFVAKSEETVTQIDYTIEEYFEQAHNNSTENKTYIIGTASVQKEIKVTPLEPKLVEFEVPVSFEKGSFGDKAVYSGDMALMNKFSDRAKKSSSKYKITATITIDWSDDPITTSEKIRFK